MPAAGLIITAAGAAYSASQQKKAAKEAAKAGQAAQVDPEEIANLTRQQSLRNLRESLEAERQFLPGQQEFRSNSLAELARTLGISSAGSERGIAALEEQIAGGGTASRSGLLTEAIGRARSDLARGGALDPTTRAEVTRNALAGAARAGGGGLGLGRFITARDLGRSSMDVATERLGRAAQLGQTEQSMNQADFENLLTLRRLREELGGNQLQRAFAAGQFGQSLQAPQVGLSPGDYSSLYVQNATNAAKAGQNAAALRAQTGQNTGQLGSMLGGAVSTYFAGRN